MSNQERKLAAIVYTDIVGFSELSASDENYAIELVNTQRDIVEPLVETYGGFLHKEIGDGFLITFPTATSAVEFGIDFQRAVKHVDGLNIRIGIHEGEVTVQNDDVFGDDINVGARIEPYSPTGGIAVSEKVKLEISSLPEYETEFIVEPELKGIKQPIKIYCISSHGLAHPHTTIHRSSKQTLKSKFAFNILSVTGLLLTVLGGGFWFWYGLGDLASAHNINMPTGIKKSIAILSFENHTGNKEGDYFCSALTEQVRASLSKLGKLNVSSRFITEKLKRKNTEINEALFNELDYYVEGTLSKVAENRNINLSLINAKNHKTKWSKQYTFVESEIVQYKDTILNNIAFNLDIDYQPVQLVSHKEVYKNSDEFKMLGHGLYDFENNNFISALSSFNSILDRNPENIEAKFHKANTLVELNRADEAINIYNDLVSITQKYKHFGWEWFIKPREDVKNLVYSDPSDW